MSRLRIIVIMTSSVIVSAKFAPTTINFLAFGLLLGVISGGYILWKTQDNHLNLLVAILLGIIAPIILPFGILYEIIRAIYNLIRYLIGIEV